METPSKGQTTSGLISGTNGSRWFKRKWAKHAKQDNPGAEIGFSRWCNVHCAACGFKEHWAFLIILWKLDCLSTPKASGYNTVLKYCFTTYPKQQKDLEINMKSGQMVTYLLKLFLFSFLISTSPAINITHECWEDVTEFLSDLNAEKPKPYAIKSK